MQEANQKNIRFFGLFSALILVLIGARMFYKFHNPNHIYFDMAGGIFAASSLLCWPVLKPVYIAWIKIAGVIGWFNTRLIFIIFFYLLLAPIGILLRIFHKDLLELAIDKKRESYWIKKEKKNVDLKQYEKQY